MVKPESRTKKDGYSAPGPRVVEFPQVTGKTLQAVEFATSAEVHTITLRFRDKTELVFDLEPGFTVFPTYADWRTGDWRPIKRWGALHSRIFRE